MVTIAIELAQAYISITPSLRGAKRQIESELSGVDMTAAGSKMGAELSGAMGTSLDFSAAGQRLQDLGGRVSDIGGSLTKHITLPALGAAAAIGGITAALGWRRLVALDTAQAQLRGLGYEAEDVERITIQVTDAIEGGMTTMAEGTAIAAGALAAGVDEGADLERYIRLVGDAAVGANRPVDEMAQIFNRVEGSGRLMTQELNMIEQGLPGFAATMADSMGVSQDEFRAMVTAGQVSSEEFLDVMDGFAGGMAEAYADSWEGMVANTKAYVGILGESLLGGVFEQSKDSLAEFQEFLASDEAQQWAAEMGQSIGEAFGRIVETVQSAIEWWNELDDSTKQLIGTFAGVAVAAGPVLMVAGRIMTVVGGLLKIVAPVAKALGGLGAAFGGAGAAGGGLLTTLLRFAGPIGLIVSGLIMAWQQSEEFRDAVMELGDALMGAFQEISSALMPVLTEIFGVVGELGGMLAGLIGDVATSLAPIISMIAGLLSDLVSSVIVPLVSAISAVLIPVIQSLMPVVQTVFGIISSVIGTVMKVVQGIIKAVTQAISGDWSGAWDAIRDTFSGVWDSIKSVVSGALKIVQQVLSAAWKAIRTLTSTAWNAVRTAIATPINAARNAVSTALNLVRNAMSAAWSAVRTLTTNAWNNVRTGVSNAISNVVSTVRGLPRQAISALGNIGSTLLSSGRDLVQGFINGIRNMAGSVISAITGTITNALPNFVKNALGISSPSKLFREFGLDVMKGFAIGLSSGGDGVLDEMDSVVSDLTRSPEVAVSARSGISGMGDLAPLGATTSSAQPIDFTINEAHDPMSVARTTARVLAMAGG